MNLQLRRMEAERYLALVQYSPFKVSLGDHAGARPQVQALARELDGLLAAHPGRARPSHRGFGLVRHGERIAAKPARAPSAAPADGWVAEALADDRDDCALGWRQQRLAPHVLPRI